MQQQTYILSQKINLYSAKQIHRLIKENIIQRKKLLMGAMNLHILLQLHNNPHFKKKHQAFFNIIFADGMFLVYLSKIKLLVWQLLAIVGLKEKNCQYLAINHRVSGTDLAEHLLELGEKTFLIAPSKPIIESLKKKYSTIVGGFVPPMTRIWSNQINQDIVKNIIHSKARILLIAVGPLKQEKWLMSFFRQLSGVYVAVGVGSALEILAGYKKRAPKLAQLLALEWLWRIILEPSRLLPRYIQDMIDLVRLTQSLILGRNLLDKFTYKEQAINDQKRN